MATFSLDAMVEPTYIDILDIAAGYGIFSTPVDGILTGDLIQMLSLVVTPAAGGAAVFSKSIDIAQRADGYFEYVTQSEIDGHFTLTGADIAAIATGSYVYSCSLYLYRDGALITREYQGGAIAPRPTVPLPPLLVNTIAISGGPYTGVPAAQHQLTAATYDAYGNVITGFTVTWASTNPNIASVDATGLVTLVTPGAVTISATCQGVTATTTITVSTAPIVAADGDVMFYSSGSSSWVPHQPTADRILPGTFGGGSVYHFAHGLTIDAAGLTVTAGGLTVASGTSALQSLTATTGAFSSTLSAAGVTSSAGLTVTGAVTVSGTINGQTISSAANFTGSVTVANGFVVTSGTSAHQALTATTGVFSGALSGVGLSSSTTLNVTGAATIGGTITGQLVNALTFGAHLTGGSYNNTGAVSLATDATSANTAGTIVARDGSGNFAAGSITAATGITVTTGGVTISAGTLSAQAITGTTGAFSGDFAIATNKFTVAASSGNTVVAGTLGVTGLSTLGAVNAGATAVTGTLTTTSTINGQTISASASLTGSLTVANGFTVTAGTSAHQALTATTGVFSSTVTVSSGGVTVTGASTITGTLAGITTLTATTIAGTLSTAAQPNITSVGVLVSPHMTGAVVDSGGLSVVAGTTAVQALTATTGMFTGSVQTGQTLITQDGIAQIGAVVTATSHIYAVWGNGVGRLQFGVESSTGGNIFAGTSAYSTVFGNTVTRSLHLATNNTVALTIDSTQHAVFASSVDAASYKVGGVAGANFGPGAVASITVVNGIVTAIS